MRGAFDMRQVRRSFGRAATSYETHAVLQGEVESRLQERLDDAPLMPTVVIDAGSGSGRGAATLRKRYPKSTLLALDLALPMLRAARRHQTWLRPFNRICADVQALPLAEASVDLLYSNLCLQWCADLPAVLNEFRRVMTPGALLLFSTFGPDTLRELRNAFSQVDHQPHVSPFADMQVIGDAMLAAGFRDPVLERDVFTMTYPDGITLMRELRAIGATNADPSRQRTLTGKAHLRAVLDAYETMRSDGVLPATYEVVYARAVAPDAGQPRRASGGGDIASFPIDQLRGSRRGV